MKNTLLAILAGALLPISGVAAQNAASPSISSSASPAAATVSPEGRVLELHACELYTGGCTASAQSTLGGRSLLRVWSFDRGSQDGVELRGLEVAALQVAEENLAFRETKPATAVVYLPARASDVQRAALLSWLKQAHAEFATAPLIEKTTAIDLAWSPDASRISARIGDGIALQTRALGHCDLGGCGEALWYSPRTETSTFTVLIDERSSVREPAVSLVWKNNGTNSVFLGRFGGVKISEPSFSLGAVE